MRALTSAFNPDPELVVKSIHDLNGNLAAVCKQFNVARSTFVGWLNRHPEIADELVVAREEMLDMAETSLYRRVLAGDAWAVCCVKDTRVTLADGASKPIQDVQVKDWVLTHTGKVARVEAVYQRAYTGDVLALEVSGLPLPLLVTPEHPIYARVRKGAQQIIRNRPLQAVAFYRADELAVGDVLHTPTPFYTDIETPCGNLIDAETAFILGIYAAEGRAFNLDEPAQTWQMKPKVTMYRTQGDRARCLEFSLNTAGDARLLAAIEQYGVRLNAPVQARPHSQTSKCQMVYLSNRPFARFCAEHVGIGSHAKQLSLELMAAPPYIQRQFLAGYLLGDGSISARKDGSRADSITVTTASSALAQQLLLMLANVGVVATLKYGLNNGGPKNRHVFKPRWSLYIRPRECMQLAAVLNHEFQPRDARTGPRQGYDFATWGRLRSIQRVSYSGIVYNLQVANYESYVANLISVHNCFFLKTQGRKRGYIERAETFSLNVNLDNLSIEQLERLAAGEHPSLVLGAAADAGTAGSTAADPLTIEGASSARAEAESVS